MPPLKPERIAQIEFTEWIPDGNPRHRGLLVCGNIKILRKWYVSKTRQSRASIAAQAIT